MLLAWNLKLHADGITIVGNTVSVILYDCRIDGRSTSFTCMVSSTRIIQSYNTIYRFIISFLLEIYEYMKMYYSFFYDMILIRRIN